MFIHAFVVDAEAELPLQFSLLFLRGVFIRQLRNEMSTLIVKVQKSVMGGF